MAEEGGSHLVLVGLPGSGKSEVGQAVAARLGRDFLDFDREIVRRQRKSIAAIFAERGEAWFRELERELTVELRERPAMILSPGGGWVTRSENVALLRPPARLLYLAVTPATAVRRMGAGVRKRPLLRHADPVAELARLLDERRPAYESADFVLDVEMLTPQQVSAAIIREMGPGGGNFASWGGTPG